MLMWFGDFEQLRPVSSTWRGCPMALDILGSSRLCKHCFPMALVLTRCHMRGAATFEFYSLLPALPFDDAKRLARKRSPLWECGDWNIVIGHAQRHCNTRERRCRPCAGKETLGAQIQRPHLRLLRRNAPAIIRSSTVTTGASSR